MTPKFVYRIFENWPQWVAAMTVCLLSTSLGLVAGWTSPYLAQLTSEGSPLPITQRQASWVASLMPLGRLFGAIAGSVSVEYLGSKSTVLLSGWPPIIGWICIIFANSAAWLYVSRIFSGISMGMIFSCFPLYIGEISAPSIRGALVGLILNGLPLGTLMGNTMGAYMSMMWFGVISLVVNIFFITIFPFLPRTPYYYVRHGNLDKAQAAIRWYHRGADVTSQLNEVEHFISSSKALNLRERIRQLNEPKNRRALLTIILLFIFMQLSGLNTIIFYMEIIVTKARVTSIAPSAVVILVNTIGIVLGWIGTYSIDRCGRRILLAISSCGVVIGMTLLGLHFLLLEQQLDPANFEWLPILALNIFMMLCVGLVPVPSTLLSELFPVDLKSFAGFCGSVTSALFAFIASKTYQPLVDVMREQYVFWIYAIIIAVCLVYSLVGIPETKGKTLQEIQEMLAGQSGSQRQRQEDSNQLSEVKTNPERLP